MGTDRTEERNRNWRPPKAPPVTSVEQPLLPASQSNPSGSLQNLYTSLCALLTCDTGWLRVVPSDGDLVYYKWKWTTGPHANHYVMVVGTVGEVSENLVLLERKKSQVEAGQRPATLDRYFGGEK